MNVFFPFCSPRQERKERKKVGRAHAFIFRRATEQLLFIGRTKLEKTSQ